uniref:ATP-dependent DNA helicase n=1 Tax=Mycena chlorophos TaxID=658473 RepID=A0ABQ0KU56_MYCCL|nr:predicted protein [Mycena chlorophos]
MPNPDPDTLQSPGIPLRSRVSADLLDSLASCTLHEIINLIAPYTKPPRNIKRRRDTLLGFVESLPVLAQVIITAVAKNSRGSKRTRTEGNEELQTPAPKRRRRQVAAMTATESGAEADESVHSGDLQNLIDGPFLAPIDGAVVRDCIARCIDRTGNDAMRKEVCMCCARRLFLDQLEEFPPELIPNKHLLKPTHPHPAHQLWEGLLLHRPAIRHGRPSFLCSQCSARLRLHERPQLSLANNMWVGPVPFALSILTLPKRLLIALYFPAAYVVKLFPKTAGGKKWNKERINSGMRGNVSTYRLNTSDIADMVTGHLMPRPVEILAAVISVAFVGAKNVPLRLLPEAFDVRRHRVADALAWLKINNPLYADVVISQDRLGQLPEGGVPEEILQNVRYSEEESILNKEHAGYVPVDLGDEDSDADVPAAEEADDEENIDGEERAMDVDNEQTALHRVDKEEEAVEEHEAAAFPLQAHGSIDIAGDGIPDEEIFASAARNLFSSRKEEYGVQPSSGFVSEYARESRGQRMTGGPDAPHPDGPNHLLGAFPVLFPYGLGGLEVDRQEAVPYETHVRWCLQYDDGRFRQDLHFVFQVFGVESKRSVAASACMQVKRSTYIANEAAFRRLKVHDFVLASKEEANKQTISNPVIRSLRKQLTAVRARVMGTDESRIGIRAQVWGMILRFNPPTLWMTINLSDTNDPIAQVLAGQEIDLNNFLATSGPDSDARSRIIANDPYAAAEFFHLVIRILLEELFGITINIRGSITRKPGIVGTVNGYIGTVEAQARGTLHLHMLMWLRGAPVAAVMKTALQSAQFREKIKSFIGQNIRAHIPGTNATTLTALPLGRNIAYSRPEDPRQPDYNSRAAAAEARIARAVQVHDCKPFTCLKMRKGRLVCKRRAPWRTAEDDWVTEDGDWGPKRLYSFINGWNPPLMQVTRCNQDMKLITNGAETKDITFYITLYIAKRQIQAANTSALLAKSTAFQERYQCRTADTLRLNKRLLQRCTNTLSRQHEFSAPEVVSYLMGWGDRFISHTYVKIYWDPVTAQLRRTFPNLQQVEHWPGMESIMTLPEHRAEQVRIPVDEKRRYEQNIPGQHGGEALESMSFYEYFSKTYDGKFISRSSSSTAAPEPRRFGGRPLSQRVPYRASAKRKRCRVVRAPNQEVNLHFIGRWFLRNEDGTREYYCAQMLLLFTPWRELSELPRSHSTFESAFNTFLRGASAEQKRIIQNIHYFYECSDHAGRRREEEEQAAQRAASAADSAGEDRGVTTAVANTMAAAAMQEPTEADIERAREERHAARDRVYGQAAIEIAMEHRMFSEKYATVPVLPLARQATVEDTAQYAEWGAKVLNFVRASASGAKAESDQAGENGGDQGEVVAEIAAENDGSATGGVVNLTPPAASGQQVSLGDLNEEQMRAHEIVVHHLQETLEGRAPPQLLMIIQGTGGTGKTLLLESISQSFDVLNASGLLAKTATTGVAASLFGGQTLHNWAGIRIRDSSVQPSQATKDKRQRNMAKTKYLIIDEYSMLTKKLLEQLSKILGSIKEPMQECQASDCFGGINVVLVGDLHQFPPVGNIRQSLFYDGDGAEDHSPLGLDLYRRFSTVVTLTEQRRVTDPVWMEFLGRLRQGACTEGDMQMLGRLRVGEEDSTVDWNQPPWTDSVLVTPRHTVRSRWNEESIRRHAALTGNRVYRFPAEDTVSKTGAELGPWDRFMVAQSTSRQTGKLSDQVQVCVGRRAMVVLNISTDADLANGTRGVIQDVVLDSRETPLKSDSTTGEILLRYPPEKTSFPKLPGLEEGVIPIVPSRIKFAVSRVDKSRVTVARRQVAITPGYAFTDYKLQGQTIEHVVIDLGATPSGALTPFNAYVALSRSRGRGNIRILRGFDYKLFTTHPSVFLRREDERLAWCTLETKREQ